MVCNVTEFAAAGRMVTWTSSRSGDQSIVQGLIPDGIQEVTLIATNGATKTVPVHDNVYGAVLDGHFTSVRITGPTGTVVLGPW